MPVSWTIERNGGGPISLEGWGISSISLSRASLDADVLTFTIPVESALTETVFEYDDVIVLRRDGVRRFVGTITAVPVTGVAPDDRANYVAKNAWHALTEIVYRQPYAYYSDATTLASQLSTRVILGQDSWGRKITSSQQIANIAAYALSQGAGLYTLATIPTLTEIYLQEGRDITCADAIRRMVALTPDCVTWFDYTTTPPTLHLARRSALTPVSLDFADANLIQAFTLGARHDLLIPGVVFTFNRTELLGEGPIRYNSPTIQTAGATSGRRVVFATFDLLDGEPIPTGLATAYYGARSVLHYAGTITLKERDCSGQLLPGHVLNLVGGPVAWETMSAVVQQSIENLLTGTTEVTLGPPEHLSPQDFVAIMTPFRNRHSASGFANNQHNGTEGVPLEVGADPGITGIGPAPALPGDDADEDGNVPEEDRESNPTSGYPSPPPGLFSSVDVPVCRDGVEVTARLVGFVI